MTDGRVSQEGVLVLYQATPDGRLSQTAILTLYQQAQVQARLSQTALLILLSEQPGPVLAQPITVQQRRGRFVVRERIG